MQIFTMYDFMVLDKVLKEVKARVELTSIIFGVEESEKLVKILEGVQQKIQKTIEENK